MGGFWFDRLLERVLQIFSYTIIILMFSSTPLHHTPKNLLFKTLPPFLKRPAFKTCASVEKLFQAMLDFKSTGKLHVEGEAEGDLGSGPQRKRIYLVGGFKDFWFSPFLPGEMISNLTSSIFFPFALMASRGTKYLFFCSGSVFYWFYFLLFVEVWWVSKMYFW